MCRNNQVTHLLSQGQCGGYFHPSCQNIKGSCNVDQFRCLQCKSGKHLCFICKEADKEGEQPIKCQVANCGKWYHLTCLTRYTIWPQHKTSSGHIYCPDHTCHTCASDNPRDPLMKYNEKLMHCVRCPTAYHAGK